MAGKREKFDLNHLIERCKAGESLKDLAAECGVSDRTLYVWFGELGFKAADLKMIDRFDVPALHAEHLAGVSIQAISKRIGVSRITLNRWFEQFGLEFRGRSEGASVRMRQMSAADRRALVAKAHGARRGQVDSLEVRSKRAAARLEMRVGKYELELIQALAARGVKAESQWPVGPYNLDVFLNEFAVAVEIYSVATSPSRFPYLHERTEYLLDRGISQLTVQASLIRYVPDIERLADEVLAFAYLARGAHSVEGQQGVIRGDGQRLPGSGHYVQGRPVVPCF